MHVGTRKNQRKEEFTDETPIFANFSKNAQNKHLSLSSLNYIIDKIIHRSGIVRVKDSAMYDKARTKMFRKRFNSKFPLQSLLHGVSKMNNLDTLIRCVSLHVVTRRNQSQCRDTIVLPSELVCDSALKLLLHVQCRHTLIVLPIPRNLFH